MQSQPVPSTHQVLPCLCALFLGWLPTEACLAADPAAGILRILVHAEGSGDPVPCRVHLRNSEGHAIQAPGLPFWRDHFVGEGRFELVLPPGEYRYEIERGPEFHSVAGRVDVVSGSASGATHELRRIARLASEGWWSGETHVHRSLQDIELLMRAEDLHIAPVITWWNSRGPWASNPPPAELVVRHDQNRFYAPLAGEDERGGGALLYIGLSEPLSLDYRLGREHPSSTKYLGDAKARPGCWVDIEKPFWWDTPIWLASGLVDSVGIAHNHMHRGGVYVDEAWGRPRDVSRFPAPQGNGRYTQELYYQMLNAGLRIPPSAGSASGVLPNPVGYNRAYVHLEGDLTWDKWWAGLRAGRVFVSNGPLLRARANGEFPGHVFRADGPLTLDLKSQLDSRDPIAAVELVRNGQIQRIPASNRITFQESGWFLIRAITKVSNTFRFASTGPWYVEIGNQPRVVHRQAAEFFLNWTRERRATVAQALSNATQRAEAVAPIEKAERFWQAKVNEATKSAATGDAPVP